MKLPSLITVSAVRQMARRVGRALSFAFVQALVWIIDLGHDAWIFVVAEIEWIVSQVGRGAVWLWKRPQFLIMSSLGLLCLGGAIALGMNQRWFNSHSAAMGLISIWIAGIVILVLLALVTLKNPKAGGIFVGILASIGAAILAVNWVTKLYVNHSATVWMVGIGLFIAVGLVGWFAFFRKPLPSSGRGYNSPNQQPVGMPSRVGVEVVSYLQGIALTGMVVSSMAWIITIMLNLSPPWYPVAISFAAFIVITAIRGLFFRDYLEPKWNPGMSLIWVALAGGLFILAGSWCINNITPHFK